MSGIMMPLSRKEVDIDEDSNSDIIVICICYVEAKDNLCIKNQTKHDDAKK